MGTIPHVLHTGARPIHVLEFVDAVRATCPPRFPATRGNQHRPVALAISGGVDSMALAYLCTRLRQFDPMFKISDNPVSGFRAMIIDHRLREGSDREAGAVAAALKTMGVSGDIYPLIWSKVLGDYNHPKDLPNFESLARKLRYRRLGAACGFRKMASLMLAHHEDDQYETILMRLMQGHGSRGLRGMRKASDIPECEGEFGAWQSGYVDDQNRPQPFYNNRLSKWQRKDLRYELRSKINRLMDEDESRDHDQIEYDDYDLEEFYLNKRAISFDPFNIAVEDGGVCVYRPLLEFSKDRLIATCLANNIPWWEDPTNQDATLTMRNAVRHLYKGYTLPVALQKPSVLALSKRCDEQAQAIEAEARRLLTKTIIHDFEPNVGTLTVQFPDYGLALPPRDMRSSLRSQARRLRQREVAGLLIQRILLLVSPELQPSPVSNLQNVISRLFPALSNSEDASSTEKPKAFNIAGIHLTPVESASRGSQPGSSGGGQLSWYLTRTPYSSTLPVPRFRTPYWSVESKRKKGRRYQRWKWSQWLRWTLWDGRFWMRMTHRLPYRVIVQPFVKEHAKALRELLSPDDRDRLAVVLKRYAPGKVRYTLPAIYLEEDLDLENVVPRPGYPNPSFQESDTKGVIGDQFAHPKVLDVSKLKLIALPTLDIQVPKLEDWLVYEVRYKRADRSTLESAGTYDRTSFVDPKRANGVFVRAPRSRAGRRISRRRNR
ncbi:Uu.00g063290.m01.CDS01 [Anthostomella pinea]|uniref:tRNA(Ile)-lysidine synthetase n=1 Tax=Anthostomella pinea TaxID=933095 RepID=A0AAI8VTD7_9PEZI|nr:Uu.00g063290.m01.CDS01 [Anthostomella pinea]